LQKRLPLTDQVRWPGTNPGRKKAEAKEGKRQ
jgi:hypothetical protein